MFDGAAESSDLKIFSDESRARNMVIRSFERKLHTTPAGISQARGGEKFFVFSKFPCTFRDPGLDSHALRIAINLIRVCAGSINIFVLLTHTKE